MSMMGAVGVFSEPMGRWQGESGFLLSHSASSLSLPPELDIRTSIKPPPFRIDTGYAKRHLEEICGVGVLLALQANPLLIIPSVLFALLTIPTILVKTLLSSANKLTGEITSSASLILLGPPPEHVYVYIHYFGYLLFLVLRARLDTKLQCFSYPLLSCEDEIHQSLVIVYVGLQFSDRKLSGFPFNNYPPNLE
ncbi:unnamed protein product, partial [Meganyctiphanes norvegica]